LLESWDALTLMVIDFKHIMVNELDINGDRTGTKIPATQGNIIEQAKRKGITERKYRERLLDF